MKGGYPWQGTIDYTIVDGGVFTLAIHIPGHVKNFVLQVNHKAEEHPVRNGYVCIRRNWKAGDMVMLRFEMPVRRLHADIRVRSCAGRIALARGPFIYCFEEEDQPVQLSSVSLPSDAAIDVLPALPGLPKEIVCLSMEGHADLSPDAQYSADQPERVPCRLRAIPYYAWANRLPGNMLVWIREHP